MSIDGNDAVIVVLGAMPGIGDGVGAGAGAAATGGVEVEVGAAGATVSVPPGVTGMCMECDSEAISAALRGSRANLLPSILNCPRNANACVPSVLSFSAPPHAEMAAMATNEIHPPMRDILAEEIIIR